jgi:hypothetical protein
MSTNHATLSSFATVAWEAACGSLQPLEIVTKPCWVYVDTDTLYARFENEYGFDGDHHICGQGAHLSDAIQAAREKGWSPIPTDPGILSSQSA